MFSLPLLILLTASGASASTNLQYSTNSAKTVYVHYSKINTAAKTALGSGLTEEQSTIMVADDLPVGCKCPSLLKVYSNEENGVSRLDTSAGSKTFGVVGYIAPYPGYCGSVGALAVLELYSPILNQYKYTGGLGWGESTDYTNLFRPTRVLGYGFYYVSGNHDEGQKSQAEYYKSYVIRVNPVKTYTKNGKTSTAASLSLQQKLVAEGWTVSGSGDAGPLSETNEIEKIRATCGTLQKCEEVYNADGEFYRVINSDVETTTDKAVSSCGYFLAASSSKCGLTDGGNRYSGVDSNGAYYRNWGSGNSVGFAMTKIATFVKKSVFA